MRIIEDIKRTYKSGGINTRILYINIGLFTLVKLITIFITLFGINGSDFSFLTDALAIPANIMVLAVRPWTIISYQFIHFDFFHLLVNMMWLFWFSQLFLRYYSQHQLLSLYIGGGLLGAAYYILAYNFIPYYSQGVNAGQMVGASASILAIVVATAVASPNDEIQLMIIGKVKMKYLAIGVIGIDLLSITTNNAGGHIAHLGGAFAGLIFAKEYMKNNRDITSWITRIIDFFSDLIASKKKPKMKARHTGTDKQADRKYNSEKKEQEANINQILEKIKISGYKSLSKSEKAELFNASSKK